MPRTAHAFESDSLLFPAAGPAPAAVPALATGPAAIRALAARPTAAPLVVRPPRRRDGLRRTVSLGAATLAAVLTLAVSPATSAFAAAPAAIAPVAGTATTAAAPSYASTLVAPAIRATQPPVLAAFDRALLLDVNHARAAYHLPPLAPLAGLVGVANVWATHLAVPAATFRHNPSLAPMVKGAMPTVRAFGENIAAFSVGSLSAYSLLKAYLASPEHRANIMSPHYHYVGIVTRDGGDGMSYNTMDFVG